MKLEIEIIKYQFTWYASFQEHYFLKLILILKFQNVPCALGFEAKH